MTFVVEGSPPRYEPILALPKRGGPIGVFP
jgi:hypothetical protein